jgi:hypothetical protein
MCVMCYDVSFYWPLELALCRVLQLTEVPEVNVSCTRDQCQCLRFVLFFGP